MKNRKGKMQLKLLICEDEETTRHALRKMLQGSQLGIEEVLEASDGVQGLKMAEKYRPELVLTDIRMPGLDGIQMAREILAVHPESRIIMVSAYTDLEYLKHAIQIGAVDYLFKPIQMDELESVLENAILQSRSLHRKQELLQLVERQEPYLKENFVKRLVSGQFINLSDALQEGRHLFSLSEQQSYALARVFPGPEIREQFVRYHERCQEILSSGSLGQTETFCWREGEELLALFLFEGEIPAAFRTGLSGLKRQMEESVKIGRLICLFEMATSLSGIPHAYQKLMHGEKEKEKTSSASPSSGVNQSLLVSRIKEIVSSEYSDPALTVNAIAVRLHYTTAYICMMFRRETGSTPGDYIAQVRMLHAKRLLQDVSLKFSEIAALTGYENENYFSKVFKKYEGITPTEFRKIRCEKS